MTSTPALPTATDMPNIIINNIHPTNGTQSMVPHRPRPQLHLCRNADWISDMVPGRPILIRLYFIWGDASDLGASLHYVPLLLK